MTMLTQIAPKTATAAEILLGQFMLANAEALIGAAALLGGQPAVSRIGRLLEALVDTPPLTRRLRRELVELHKLLSLDRVDDLASLEAACFAEIDPASEAVQRICALTDAMRAHLRALADAEFGDPAGREIYPVA